MLVYLYVENYKNLIKEQGYLFTKKYIISIELKKNNILISKNSNYENNYFYDVNNNNINLNSIVGRNGSGKSTFLKMISNIKSNEFFKKNKVLIILENKDKLFIINETRYNIITQIPHSNENPQFLKEYNLIYFTNVINFIDESPYGICDLTTNNLIYEHAEEQQNFNFTRKSLKNFFLSFQSQEIFTKLNFITKYQGETKFNFIPKYTIIKLINPLMFHKESFTEDEEYLLEDITDIIQNFLLNEVAEDKAISYDFFVNLLLNLLMVILLEAKYENRILTDIHYNNMFENKTVNTISKYNNNNHKDLPIKVTKGLELLKKNISKLVDSYDEDYNYNKDVIDEFKKIIINLIEHITIQTLLSRYRFNKVNCDNTREFEPSYEEITKLDLEYTDINNNSSLEDYLDLNEENIDFDHSYIKELRLFEVDDKGEFKYRIDENKYKQSKQFNDHINIKVIKLINIFHTNFNKFKKESEGLVRVRINDEFFSSFIDLYKKIVKKFNVLEFSWYNLSSGEEASLNMYSKIFKGITDAKLNYSNYIIMLDECDLFLHPLWQKSLIHDLLEFFKFTLSECNINIFLTTHSPFILSDILKENIIFFENSLEKELCNIATGINRKQTFASNIHTLLTDSFFMDSTIGNYAKEKIRGVIKDLVEKSKEELEKDNKRKNEIENIIKNIGEPIIKEKLEKQYFKVFPDDLLEIKKDEIETLKQELQALENNKNYVDIINIIKNQILKNTK